jgi:hypothetical protein
MLSKVNSLELQSAFSCTISGSFYTTMVQITASVEYYCCNAQFCALRAITAPACLLFRFVQPVLQYLIFCRGSCIVLPLSSSINAGK